jgi:hypothetical protein
MLAPAKSTFEVQRTWKLRVLRILSPPFGARRRTQGLGGARTVIRLISKSELLSSAIIPLEVWQAIFILYCELEARSSGIDQL